MFDRQFFISFLVLYKPKAAVKDKLTCNKCNVCYTVKMMLHLSQVPSACPLEMELFSRYIKGQLADHVSPLLGRSKSFGYLQIYIANISGLFALTRKRIFKGFHL